MLSSAGKWVSTLSVVARLRFTNSHLEALYAAYCVNNKFLCLDQFWAKFHVVLYAVLLCTQRRKSGLFGLHMLMAGFHSALIFLHWWVMSKLRPSWGDRWVERRAAVAVALRILFFPVVPLIAFPWWFTDPVTGFGTFIRFMFTNCGILISTCCTFFAPLFLKTHIPIHSASLCIHLLFHIPRGCGVAVEDQQGRWYFTRIWESLTWASGQMLNILYLDEARDVVTPEPQTACKGVIAWWLLLAGFVLPTCSLWVWEHNSRSKFLEDMPPDDVREEDHEHWQPVKHHGLLWYAAPLVLFLAISWQLLLKVTISPSEWSLL